ncbi:MAG TPA: DNRLRE domain-containing protein [Syntrophomonadaceae bacterium]|nr:DNRLRE domain-containing protein [Syntrophomonadaceae bacterium]HQE23058.1 DNRLRE domain-containing protein [Syntrophomonadaceae bacterium]
MAKVSILPFQDAYVSEWYASQNFGGEIALFVSQYLKPGDDYRSLLQFNVDKIPPASTIEEATLELTIYRNEVSGKPINVTVHRLLGSWNQYSVTWNNQPKAKSTPDGVVTIFSGPPDGKVRIDITDLVIGWYDGSIPNHGLLLKGNERNNNLVGFRSTNFEDREVWPVLHIKFTDEKLKIYDQETLVIPDPSQCAPLEASTPIPLGARTKATFLVKNDSDCEHVRAMLQVGHSDNPLDTFFDVGSWIHLKPSGYPGEAVALSTDDAAEYARVLVRGQGGEKVLVWPRSYEL